MTIRAPIHFIKSENKKTLILVANPVNRDPVLFSLDYDLNISELEKVSFRYSEKQDLLYDCYGTSILQYIAKILYPDKQCAYASRSKSNKRDLRAGAIKYFFKN